MQAFLSFCSKIKLIVFFYRNIPQFMQTLSQDFLSWIYFKVDLVSHVEDEVNQLLADLGLAANQLVHLELDKVLQKFSMVGIFSYPKFSPIRILIICIYLSSFKKGLWILSLSTYSLIHVNEYEMRLLNEYIHIHTFFISSWKVMSEMVKPPTPLRILDDVSVCVDS